MKLKKVALGFGLFLCIVFFLTTIAQAKELNYGFEFSENANNSFTITFDSNKFYAGSSSLKVEQQHGITYNGPDNYAVNFELRFAPDEIPSTAFPVFAIKVWIPANSFLGVSQTLWAADGQTIVTVASTQNFYGWGRWEKVGFYIGGSAHGDWSSLRSITFKGLWDDVSDDSSFAYWVDEFRVQATWTWGSDIWASKDIEGEGSVESAVPAVEGTETENGLAGFDFALAIIAIPILAYLYRKRR